MPAEPFIPDAPPLLVFGKKLEKGGSSEMKVSDYYRIVLNLLRQIIFVYELTSRMDIVKFTWM